jgi:hypothetical protein
MQKISHLDALALVAWLPFVSFQYYKPYITTNIHLKEVYMRTSVEIVDKLRSK